MGQSMLARIPVGKPKVLLLGISYPSVEKQMEKHGFESDLLVHKDASVDQAIECVRRGILTEMDARDLARCVATEQACDVDAYSSSREIGAVYRDDRHVYGDFNNRNFCKTLKKAFGQDVQFSQVILDYYWMPSGWLVTRWAKTLFQQTLPDLVRMNMLTYPSLRSHKRSRKGSSVVEGVVYLPFCAHVCKELVGGIHVLEKFYTISFVNKSELSGHSLWKGTMSIDEDTMQHVLGKRLDQEEVYCTFRPKDIFENMEDSHVSKPAVMRVLEAIEDYDNIRMICLRPLRQHEPPSLLRQRLVEPEKGGFIGLNYELVNQKRKKAEAKVRRKKQQAKLERERIQKEEKKKNMEMEIEIKRKREIERRKKVQERRVKKTQARANRKALKSKQDKRPMHVVFDVEEIPVEESKYALFLPGPAAKYTQFFPGPAANIKAYDEPGEGIAVHGHSTPSNPPDRYSGSPSVAVGTPKDYLAYNPRLKQDFNDRPQTIEYDDWSTSILDMCFPNQPRQRKKIRKKDDSDDNMDVLYLKGEQLARAKDSGYHGSAAQYVYIPEGTHEIDCAYKLLACKWNSQNIREIKSKVYDREELTCFKIPVKDQGYKQELSTAEKIKYDRWKVRIARNAYGSTSIQDGLLHLGRVESMNGILAWLIRKKDPFFDPSGYFSKTLPSLELSGSEELFEVAEIFEQSIYKKNVVCLDEFLDKSEEWKSLHDSVLRWLRCDHAAESDDADEFYAMKETLAINVFDSDAALAKEMTDRILFLRQVFDWKQISVSATPDASLIVGSPPQKEIYESTKRSVVTKKRKQLESTEFEMGNAKKKASQRQGAANALALLVERGFSHNMSTMPNKTGRAVGVHQQVPQRSVDSRLQRSSIIKQVGGMKTSSQRLINHLPPSPLTMPIQQHRQLTDIFNTTDENADNFFNEACSKIGTQRAGTLCQILLFLQNPHASFVQEKGEICGISKLIPDHTPLLQKAIMVEAILHGLRASHGKDWLYTSHHEEKLGVLLSEVLRDIESLQRIHYDAFQFKVLMGGLMYGGNQNSPGGIMTSQIGARCHVGAAPRRFWV